MLHGLPAQFKADQLQQAVAEQHSHCRAVMLGSADRTDNAIVAGEYEATLPADTAIGERLLWSYSAAERNGIEDVRLVRFGDGDGDVSYRRVYAAYDGSHIAPELVTTTAFWGKSGLRAVCWDEGGSARAAHGRRSARTTRCGLLR